MERHFRNIHGDKRNYVLQINGVSTGFPTSIKEALLVKSWDFITIQQASPSSFKYETFLPYLTEIISYVRKLCPKAKILMHQTWAYESDSDRIRNFGFEKYDEMFELVKECYSLAAKEIDADGIIPSGEVLQTALKNGINKVHRDGLHASLGAGRFMLSLTWYKFITQNSIENVKFNMFDEEVTDKEYKIAIESVNSIVK